MSMSGPPSACKVKIKSTPPKLRRQDSGYESMAGPSRSNRSNRSSRSSRSSRCSRSSPPSPSRVRPSPSTTSSESSISVGRRPTRTSLQRSGPVSHLPRPNDRSLFHRRSQTHPPQSRQGSVTGTYVVDLTSLFSEWPTDESDVAVHAPPSGRTAPAACVDTAAAYPVLPQATYYWTSDKTRRLEYAAIDAASRGVRGWVMRNMVPECFIPREKRRIGFEDDRGSVVRYRLPLDEGDDTPGKGKRRRWSRLLLGS